MVAEFANYESWIEWVPIVALGAIPLALRRVLPLSLAFVGSFVGFIWVMVAPPLGRDAEQFGPAIAIGLAGGAIAGGVIGLVIGATHTRAPRDASAIVLAWAVAFGTVGAVIGGLGPSLFDWPPDLEIRTLLSIAIGGGVGWITGTVVGWRRTSSAPLPDAVQRSFLAVAAIAIALMGTAIILTILGHQFGPSIDNVTRHDRARLPSLAILYGVDTLVAIVTVLALSVRGLRASPRALEVASRAS